MNVIATAAQIKERTSLFARTVRPAVLLLACTSAPLALADEWPLDIGNRWQFDDGTVLEVVNVPVTFASPAARAIRRTSPGSGSQLDVYTSGVDALSFEGTVTEATGSSSGGAVVYDPPIVMVDGSADSIDTTGTTKIYASTDTSGTPNLETDYQANALVVANAQLSTPAGTFTARRVRLLIQLIGSPGDEMEPTPPATTLRTTFWFVPDLGIVRETDLRTNPDTTLSLTRFIVPTSFPDSDSDGFIDIADNCPAISNLSQQDTDQDFMGNACDADDDNDGLTDVSETTTYQTDPLNPDTDGDGRTDGMEVAGNTDPLTNENGAIAAIFSVILGD